MCYADDMILVNVKCSTRWKMENLANYEASGMSVEIRQSWQILTISKFQVDSSSEYKDMQRYIPLM